MTLTTSCFFMLRDAAMLSAMAAFVKDVAAPSAMAIFVEDVATPSAMAVCVTTSAGNRLSQNGYGAEKVIAVQPVAE